jgi:uncharacterized membrane protein YphA (DoxX/SURF4 family)
MPLAKAPSKLDLTKLSKHIAAIRIGFGVVWIIDAAFKFEPVFYRGLLQSIQATDSGEPKWLNPWFHTWYSIIGSNQHLFAVILIFAESLVAISLLLGLARRSNYLLGGIMTFLIWGVGEAFGGPYVTGSTDIGAGIIYCFVFALLFVADGVIQPSWALDNILTRKISWWSKIADLNFKSDKRRKTKPANLVTGKVVSHN